MIRSVPLSDKQDGRKIRPEMDNSGRQNGFAFSEQIAEYQSQYKNIDCLGQHCGQRQRTVQIPVDKVGRKMQEDKIQGSPYIRLFFLHT